MYLVYQIMTETDKASSQFLTEEAYARSIGKAGNVPANPGPIPDSELYILHRSRLAAQTTPNAPYGYVGDRQRYYDQWEEEVFEPWSRRCAVWREWIEGYLEWRKKEAKKLHAGNNGAQLGPREFTLTYGEHYETPEEAQRVMESAIEKLTRYYRHEIIEFHAIGEYTKAGRPHVHGWYHLDGGKKITDKNFKRAYPPWNPKKKLGRGFEGGHHATIERVSDFHGYTEKHFHEAWLVKNITNDAHDHARTPAPQGILEGEYRTEARTQEDGDTGSEDA